MVDTVAHRDAFTPPPQPGLLRGLGLALAVHLLLLAALTWGVNWDRQERELSAEAELWSALPQEAAPKAVEPPTPAVEPPTPQPPPEPPQPQPRPEPPVAKPPQPDPQAQRDAEIALERQKKLEEDKRKAQLERQREREKQRKEAEARKREQEEEKREQARLAAQKKRKEAEEAKKREQEQEKRLAQQREENIRRMQMAAGTGSPTSAGAAARSSGPSDSWAGRVRARVKPNIVFTEALSGNPTAEVEVRLAPDGTIVGKRLVKSSGDAGWDQAVLRALEKTEVLPRDTDGRVPTPVLLTFRPRD